MSDFISSYDATFRKKIREIVPVMPKFRRKNNGIKVDSLTHESATLIIKMEEQSIVYAVIVEAPT